MFVLCIDYKCVIIMCFEDEVYYYIYIKVNNFLYWENN